MRLYRFIILFLLAFFSNIASAQRKLFFFNVTTNSQEYLYYGVENYVFIKNYSLYNHHCAEEMDSLFFSSANSTIKRENNCFISVFPKDSISDNSTIYMIYNSAGDYFIDSIRFLLKPIPLPNVYVDGLRWNHWSGGSYLRMLYIEPLYINKIKIEYTLIDYDLIFMDTKSDPIRYQVKKTECTFSEEDRKSLGPMRKKDRVILRNMRVKGLNNRIYKLEDITYSIF